MGATFAQSVTISVNATQNKRLISPFIYGDNLTLHLASRAYWNKYITQQAKAHGLLPFYWDEGSITTNGFGIMNRQNNTVFDQQVLDELIDIYE